MTVHTQAASDIEDTSRQPRTSLMWRQNFLRVFPKLVFLFINPIYLCPHLEPLFLDKIISVNISQLAIPHRAVITMTSPALFPWRQGTSSHLCFMSR